MSEFPNNSYMNLLNEGCSANPPAQNQPFHGYSNEFASMTPKQFQQHQQEQQQAFFRWQQSQFNAAYKRAKRLRKSDENDVDVLKRAQSIYRDEHEGVAFCQEDAWAILKFHLKCDAPEQVDLTGDVPGATQEDLFGHDAQPRPAGKP
nr:hypothetical protein [Tanacetum cinerariifolium]